MGQSGGGGEWAPKGPVRDFQGPDRGRALCLSCPEHQSPTAPSLQGWGGLAWGRPRGQAAPFPVFRDLLAPCSLWGGDAEGSRVMGAQSGPRLPAGVVPISQVDREAPSTEGTGRGRCCEDGTGGGGWGCPWPAAQQLPALRFPLPRAPPGSPPHGLLLALLRSPLPHVLTSPGSGDTLGAFSWTRAAV